MEESEKPLFIGTIISKKYRVRERLGKGAFGEVYLGVHIKTRQKVAIKREPLYTYPPQLRFEAKLYKLFQGGSGFPELLWYGIDGKYQVLVMELLGYSLKQLFTKCGEKFSLKTVVMLADQMIQRIEYVHSRNFLHRDIKPDNFTIGFGSRAHIVYLIDFGLAKRFRDTATGQVVPISKGRNLLSYVYSSANAHLGFPQGRKDDLESLGYSLIHWLKGSLPWSKLRAKSSAQKGRKIKKLKETTTLEELCSDCPIEFTEYFKYCRDLTNEDLPNYTYLRDLLKGIMKKEYLDYDYEYDWKEILEKEQIEKQEQEEDSEKEEMVLDEDQDSDVEVSLKRQRSGAMKSSKKNKRGGLVDSD